MNNGTSINQLTDGFMFLRLEVKLSGINKVIYIQHG